MSGSVVAWPAEVVKHAVARDLLIVVGAGVSRSCSLPTGVSPPSWEELLRGAVSELGLTARSPEIEALIKKERLLDAAELIRHEAGRSSRLQDLLAYIKRRVDGAPGSQFKGSAWHDALVRMEPNIIVTTNYDKIIERATEGGYAVSDYTSDTVAAGIRRREPTLLKIHGSVDAIERVVLTRTDYTRLRLVGRHALEVLQALLLTRTALFVGYGLRDPDMQLLLENVLGGGEVAPAHYLLTEDSVPDYEKEYLAFSYGVTTVTYPTGDFAAGLAALNALADEVEARPVLP